MDHHRWTQLQDEDGRGDVHVPEVVVVVLLFATVLVIRQLIY